MTGLRTQTLGPSSGSRPSESPPTLRERLAGATRELARAGCETARLDAELLLAAALGVDRAALVVDSARPLEPAEAARLDVLVERRRAREPVAYILGRKEFRHLLLAVDPRVLVPRPETELLVEVGLELPRDVRVVDVGTGSGAVALALKHERPDLEVHGTDADAGALAVARANARRLDVPVTFARHDLLAGVTGPLDAVLANLPYVAEREWEALPPEITCHEPRSALLAGPEGLELIRRLATATGAAGLVALEVGAGQAPAVAGILGEAGFTGIERRRDLAGIERVVVGRR